MSDRPAPRRRRRAGTVVRARRYDLRSYAMPAALTLVAIVIVWLVAAFIRWLSPAGNAVVVPEFVGMQYSDAERAAAAARVTLHVVVRRPDYHEPRDRIIGQLPAAGEHVREGRSIDVVVSDGEPMAKVPNVSNMSLRDATVALENARLDIGAVNQQTNEDLVEGTVLMQHPDPFTSVPAGSKVDVTVAKGRPLLYAPNFVGLSKREAADAAREAHVGLAPSVQRAIAAGAPPKGVIVAQDPPAGVQLKPHERIILQISGGAPPTPAPSPTMFVPTAAPTVQASPAASAAQPQPAASPSAASTAPPGPRAMRVSVALPQSDSPVRIRVVLVDSTGSKTLYDQVTRGGFTLSFDLSVNGVGTLQTYVGDALVNSSTL